MKKKIKLILFMILVFAIGIAIGKTYENRYVRNLYIDKFSLYLKNTNSAITELEDYGTTDNAELRILTNNLTGTGALFEYHCACFPGRVYWSTYVWDTYSNRIYEMMIRGEDKPLTEEDITFFQHMKALNDDMNTQLVNMKKSWFKSINDVNSAIYDNYAIDSD